MSYTAEDMMLDIQLRVPLNDIREKVRKDAIDEVIKECRDRTSHYLDGEPFKYMRELMDIAKYLKEQKND